VNAIDPLLVPYNVSINIVTDPSLADHALTFASTSAAGGLAEGVLGCEAPRAITIISGWNWYDGADPAEMNVNHCDFASVVTNQPGHALGLGHTSDPSSVMFAMLATGTAHQSLTVADRAIPESDPGACPLHAANSSTGKSRLVTSPSRIDLQPPVQVAPDSSRIAFAPIRALPSANQFGFLGAAHKTRVKLTQRPWQSNALATAPRSTRFVTGGDSPARPASLRLYDQALEQFLSASKGGARRP
jgi:Matrixin